MKIAATIYQRKSRRRAPSARKIMAGHIRALAQDRAVHGADGDDIELLAAEEVTERKTGSAMKG
jgi:hypothetical protein